MNQTYMSFLELFCTLFNVGNPDSATNLIENSRMNRVFQNAEKTIKYDETYLTAISMLEIGWHEGLKEISHNLEDLIFSPSVFNQQKKIILQMQKLLDGCDDYQVQKKYFTETVGAMLLHYNVTKQFPINNILTSRFNALCSYDYLKPHQFLRGEEDESHPQHIKQVYEWWDINSLLKYAVTLPNSISLHLIRSPNLYESYFCFLIKRGGNIFITTDQINHTNPLFDMTLRRPDRLMSNNIGKNKFPYYLLNISSESGELHVEEDESTALVRFQKRVHTLTTIDQLKEESLLWVILMFELYYQNYYLETKQLAEISSSMGMSITSDSEAKVNGVEVFTNQVKLEPISVSSLHSKNISTISLGSEFTESWMEDRYFHLISDESINQINPLGTLSYYSNDEKELIKSNKPKSELVSYWNESKPIELNAISATAFNTEEKLNQNRVFIARANYVKLLEHHAKLEFKNSRKDLEKWFSKLVNKKKDRIFSNYKNLKEGIFLDGGEFKRVDGIFNGFRSEGWTTGKKQVSPISIVRNLKDTHKCLKSAATYSFEGNGGYQSCYFTDAKADYAVMTKLTNIHEILDFFDIKIKTVPEFLHHYTSCNIGSRGNSLLDRIDPMASIENPFKHYDFTIIVYLSKEGYAHL